MLKTLSFALFVALFLGAPAVAQDQVKPQMRSVLDSGDSPKHPSGHVMEMDRESHKLYMNLTVALRVANLQCTAEKNIAVTVKLPQGVPRWAGASLNPDKATIAIPSGKPGVNAPEETYGTSSMIILEMNWNPEETPATNHVEYILTATFDPDLGGCLPPGELMKTEGTFTAAAHMLPAKTKATGEEQCEGELATLVEECQEPQTTDGGGGDSPTVNAALVVMMAALVVAVLRHRKD